MSNIDQMPHGPVGTTPLIDADRIDPGIRITHQQDDRIVGLAQLADVIEFAVAARVDQHAIDLTRPEHLDDAFFLREIVV
jgi:hypothetical protein